ncbi:MAG: ammonia-forming cytochrome c nitrite reductase subunit c552, partial [Deltaproteobacteria bacterium]|nr:ammonia-forming cytochrome c nitrite reductase subunit c552 [Deltaproteobacteria bacterium]
MKKSRWIHLAITAFAAAGLVGCGSEKAQIEKAVAGPKTYVGSEQCKVCHLEHYDSWKMTLHSRTLQDVTQNQDALITPIDPELIRAALKKNGQNLKVPAEKIYIPRMDEIKYTQGVQWRQRYVVEKNGKLYIAPIEYNAWSHEWTSYREADWDKRPWIEKCGGCHATGVDLEKGSFVEGGVGCEACHGPASRHVVLPKAAVFDKRQTIVNPSKLSAGIRAQICGACHGNGKSTKIEWVDWPVGFLPGRALGGYYTPDPLAGKDTPEVYSQKFVDRHHQQYDDWQQSIHAQKGVSCTSCHYVHQLGLPPTQFQTVGAGSGQCLACHTGNTNKYAHSIHSFSNCIGCHMPRIHMSPETGDVLR